MYNTEIGSKGGVMARCDERNKTISHPLARSQHSTLNSAKSMCIV